MKLCDLIGLILLLFRQALLLRLLTMSCIQIIRGLLRRAGLVNLICVAEDGLLFLLMIIGVVFMITGTCAF